MKKLFFTLFTFIFFSLCQKNAGAQAVHLDSIASFPDTIQFDNEVVAMTIYISNSGGIFFNADIAILIHSLTDSTAADTLYYNPNYQISGNTLSDTISISHTFKAADFDGGDNIVVVWPASSQLPIAVSGDSLTYDLYFKGVGVAEYGFAQSVSVYPNPSGHDMWLRMAYPEKVEQVRVFDVLGNQVMLFNEAVSKFSVESLSSGVYFVEVVNKDQSHVIKKFFRE